MKKLLAVSALLFTFGLFAPAAHAGSSPNIFGFIYQNTTSPGDGFVASAPSKSGSAACKNIFYIVAVGNCSVRQAMKNGGITQLSHYDIQRENILGIQTITVKAYGK